MNFIVQIQDWNWSDDDEGMNISAGDFHQAAEVACEFMDRKGDYTVLRGAMLMEKHGFDKDLQSLRNALELQQQKSLENAEALAASQQRCERLEKFVTKLAALDLGNPDGLHPTQHWVDEARTIIRKEPR